MAFFFQLGDSQASAKQIRPDETVVELTELKQKAEGKGEKA